MQIFLSYSSKDRELADQTNLALAGAGFDVFFDRDSLPAAGAYHDRIRAAVDQSDIFVFLISKNSLEEGCYALTELGYARRKWRHPKDHVLPVKTAAVAWAAIPPYLKAVTVLEPEGNVPAEVLAAVLALAKFKEEREPARNPREPQNPGVPSERTTKIIVPVAVAAIGLLGAILAATVPNWGKIFRKEPAAALLPTELPPAEHFHLAATEGISCEVNNVRSPFPTYFDYVDIGLSNCNSTSSTWNSASRGYRIRWPQQAPRSVPPDTFPNFHMCFPSNLADIAPNFVRDLRAAFERNKARIPCDVHLAVWRPIRLSYVDLHNQSLEVAFAQSYNPGATPEFYISQTSTVNLLKSDVLPEFDATLTGEKLDQSVLSIAAQFQFPNIPRPGN
jgi:hypothetical protein